MGPLLMMLESVVTTPGRVLVWFRWAMPYTADYHDAEFRDSRLWRWVFSAGFYFALYRFIDLGMRRGLFDAAIAHLSTAFAGR